jgi:hypothetical protein
MVFLGTPWRPMPGKPLLSARRNLSAGSLGRESEMRRTRQYFIVSWLLPYRAADAKETKL